LNGNRGGLILALERLNGLKVFSTFEVLQEEERFPIYWEALQTSDGGEPTT